MRRIKIALVLIMDQTLEIHYHKYDNFRTYYKIQVSFMQTTKTIAKRRYEIFDNFNKLIIAILIKVKNCHAKTVLNKYSRRKVY